MGVNMPDAAAQRFVAKQSMEILCINKPDAVFFKKKY